MVALATLLLLACLPLRSTTDPDPRTEWAAAQAQAASEVLAGRYGIADKVLADFAVRFPSTPEAIETSYWRALYKLDPANQTASPRDAAALFDAYLAVSAPTVHRADASALRRVASVLDRASSGTASTPAPPSATSAEEVQRLRDELAKANAELERIRRRLAQPKP
jgi:hypothetical protein